MSNKSVKTIETTSEEIATVTNETIETTTVRTDPIDLAPDLGGNNVMCAWQGLYHLFGARVESWDISESGVWAIGLTFDGNIVADADQLIHDLNYRGEKMIQRDLLLVPAYFWLDSVPAAFADAGSMTLWMAKFFRGAGDGTNTRSPEYVKKAISAYKNRNHMNTRKGRKPSKIAVDTIGSIDPSILEQVSSQELENLKATLEKVLASKTAAVKA